MVTRNLIRYLLSLPECAFFSMRVSFRLHMADVIALRPKLHYGNANDVNGISDDDNDDRYDPHDAAIGEILHFPKWETREREGGRRHWREEKKEDEEGEE